MVLAVICGTVFRLSEYLLNRSFTLDESNTALKIISQPLVKLCRLAPSPSTTMHAYPAGFLAVTKGFRLIFGDSEYALRLFPLICSIVALFLFCQISTQNFKKKTALLAVALYASSPGLVSYAAVLKPFSSDVCAALLIFFLFLKLFRHGDERVIFWILLTLTGVLGILVSFPSIFVLAAGSLFGISWIFFNRRYHDIKKVLPIVLFWAASFTVYYLLSLRFFHMDRGLVYSHRAGYVPLDSGIGTALLWIAKIIPDTLSQWLALPKWPAAVLLIFGALRGWLRKDKAMMISLLVMVMALTSSCLKLYPFGERTGSFLFPFLILLISNGVDFFLVRQHKGLKAAGIFLACFLIYQPVAFSFGRWIHPVRKEEMRPIMQYLRDRIQPSDLVYMGNSAQYAFHYYHGYLKFAPYTMPLGKIVDDSEGELSEFDPDRDVLYEMYFNGKNGFYDKVGLVKMKYSQFIKAADHERVWLIFLRNGEKQKQLILKYFQQRGIKLDEFHQPDTSIYLFRTRSIS